MSVEVTRAEVRIDRTAHLISFLGSPPILGTVYYIWLARATGPSAYDAVAILWTLLIFLPTMVLFAKALRGSIASVEMPTLAERRRFLPMTLLFASVTVYAAYRMHVPGVIEASVLAMALWLLTASLISQVWQVSLHVSSAAGMVSLGVLLAGPLALWLLWLPLVVAWSRLRLRRHDIWQVLGGAVVGGVCVVAAALAFVH